MKKDILETQEFYELMQTYRHMPITKFEEINQSFEDIKKFIRDNCLLILYSSKKQRTGLIVNGKEVYDNDIIKLSYTASGVIIDGIFSEAIGMVDAEKKIEIFSIIKYEINSDLKSAGYRLPSIGMSGGYANDVKYEIVGNIEDNPELIEKYKLGKGENNEGV